jgi:arabinofuranosyltransferase
MDVHDSPTLYGGVEAHHATGAHNLLDGACLFLVVVLLPGLILAFSEVRVIDDAYISFRYARNLATGQGLTFNAGEQVEGYTNLLWTLTMVIPEALRFPVHYFALVLGLGFAAAAVWDVWRILRGRAISRVRSMAALVPLAICPGYWLTAASGLEGGLYSFLLMRTVRALVVSKRLRQASVYGGLLFMTRPDGLLVIPICVLFVMSDPDQHGKGLRGRIREALPITIPWLMLTAAVTVWRLLYYGEPLPNTIAAKSAPTWSVARLAGNLEEGLAYCLGFLASNPPLTLGFLGGVIVARRHRLTWLCCCIFAAEVPLVVINGGDWMPHYRLLVVYAPLLVIPLGLAIERLAPSYGLAASSRWIACIVGSIVLIVVGILGLTRHEWRSAPSMRLEPTEPCWGNLARTIRPALSAGDKVSAEAIGVFSYLLPATYSHDMLGLTDAYVAKQGTIYHQQYGKAAPAYTYYNVQPTLIIVHSGFGHLKPMAETSQGRYNKTYTTYLLRDIDDCANEEIMISIRSESVQRFLPNLQNLDLQRVIVPTH